MMSSYNKLIAELTRRAGNHTRKIMPLTSEIPASTCLFNSLLFVSRQSNCIDFLGQILKLQVKKTDIINLYTIAN